MNSEPICSFSQQRAWRNETKRIPNKRNPFPCDEWQAEFLNPNATSQLQMQIGRIEIDQAVREAYALNHHTYPEGLELRMRQILDDQIEQFLHLIRGSRKDKVADLLQPSPMTSLRDVDAGVRFHPDENVDYRDLQWFNTENS